LDQAIQRERPMWCHRTLEDWIFRPSITEMKGFIYEKLLQKKPIYRLCAQWRKTLNHCISCRVCNARRRRLQVSPGTRPRVFWRPDKRRRDSNWSSKPKFGNPWHSYPQPHSRRQAPLHNPVFQFTTILYLYIISCIKSRSWNGTLDALILGTDVLCLSPYRIDALLIGPAEVEWFPVTRAI
jgi:hypothetical protein